MKLHMPPSITILPAPHDSGDELQAVEDWARGLDWVRWLLSSVRARMDVLMVRTDAAATLAAWDDFAGGIMPGTISPALKSAWWAAHAGDLEALIAADEALGGRLPRDLALRSVRAGAVLLKSTRHARYQGVLARLREAVHEGRCAGHIAVVWATVGHFFQLSLANVIAEYLHLEWDIATRDEPWLDKPDGRHSFAVLTSVVMRHLDAEPVLRVVDA